MILNIDKATGAVIDVGQTFDSRFFDNVEYPDGIIPAGDNPRYYRRQFDGAIARLEQSEIEAEYPMELARRLRSEFQTLRDQLIADVQALQAGTQKQILVNLLQLLRVVARLVRME